MRSQKFDECSLIRPRDKFWPIDRYKKMFGDPKAPRNKKLGHKLTSMDGFRGVVVPADDGEGPWELERRSGQRMEIDEEEDVGSSGGDEQLANSKFNDLKNEEAARYAELAVGAMQDVLNTMMLDEEEAQKEEARSARKKEKHVRSPSKTLRTRLDLSCIWQTATRTGTGRTWC